MALPHVNAWVAVGAAVVGIGGLLLYRQSSAATQAATDAASQSAVPLFQTAAVPSFAGGAASGTTAPVAANPGGIDAGTLATLVSGTATTTTAATTQDQSQQLAAGLFSQIAAAQPTATGYTGSLQTLAGGNSTFAFNTTGNAPVTDASFVTGLYKSVLNRAPDLPGLTAWDNALASGAMTRDQVSANFANSPEHLSALTH